MKKITALTLAVLLVLGALPMTGLTGLQSEAKTIASAKGENIFHAFRPLRLPRCAFRGLSFWHFDDFRWGTNCLSREGDCGHGQFPIPRVFQEGDARASF